MADDPARRERMRALLIGGVVGASAALAAARRRRPAAQQARPRLVGLAAFEDAPCHREALGDEGGGPAGAGDTAPRAPQL